MKIKSLTILFCLFASSITLFAKSIDSARYIGANLNLFYNRPIYKVTYSDGTNQSLIKNPISFEANIKTNLLGSMSSKRILEIQLGFEVSRMQKIQLKQNEITGYAKTTFKTINLGINYLRKIYFFNNNKLYLNLHYSIGRLLSSEWELLNLVNGAKEEGRLNLLNKENNYIHGGGGHTPNTNYPRYDLRPDVFSIGLTYRRKICKKLIVETTLSYGALVPLKTSPIYGSQGANRVFFSTSLLF